MIVVEKYSWWYYAGAGDYPKMARLALKGMQRQLGDLRIDEKGKAVQCLMVRPQIRQAFILTTHFFPGTIYQDNFHELDNY